MPGMPSRRGFALPVRVVGSHLDAGWVAQGDVGGARTLQKKWTTFLKAHLVCSAPEQQLHFNRLQAVFTLPGASWQDTTFFGVFQARW